VKYDKCSLGKAENILIDGKLVHETKVPHRAQSPMPHLVPMDAEGRLGIGKRKAVAKPPE
jgi:hypothetical protein